MLFLTESDVRQLLPMPVAVDLMQTVFRQMAGGQAQNHPRRRVILPTGSVLHYMAGATEKYFGAKIYSTHARYGAHFLFLLYAAEDARPLVLFEANYLGQIRTGAASGHATNLLAQPGAATVALIGSGFQARSQLEAMAAVRPIRSARVWSRSAEKRERFAEEAAQALSIEVRAISSAEEAVRGAQIVVTATNAREPVLESEWIADGAHVNAMGSNQAQRRELPSDLVRRASLVVVDSREQARLESGDLLMSGLPDQSWIELQDVTGRPSPGGVTLFKSNGLALEDVAAAGYVYERALEEKRGSRLPVFYS
ncbi:MAG: ornithine cyclodeaminase family protein [Acidobacteria bacterium]|nr:ornithine cyclodeaminase family protein [Acidobacteriota bacterium]